MRLSWSSATRRSATSMPSTRLMFKVLYGTGAVRVNDEIAKPERVGGVEYTIKDGIVYDAKKLLQDVADMVEKQKRERAGR